MSQDASPFTTAVLSYEEFCRCAEAWDELNAASTYPVPFMSHPWLRLWWKHFGGGQEFRAIVIRRGGELVAAAPLALRPVRFLGRSLTVCEIVGTGPVPTRGMGLADKAALLVRTRSEAALELLFEQVATLLATADVVDLKAFDESSGTRATIEHDDSRVGSVRLTQRSRSPYLTLDGTWDDYTKSRSQRFRKQLKRSARLLGEEGDWAVTRMREGDDARAWMAELLAVNDASWKAARGTNLFRCPEIRAFFEELVPEMAARGLVDLHLLRLNGEAVAYELCFRLGGTLFAYNAGYLESLEHLSLGTLNTAAVIESAFERGFAEYDMLRGDESYKLRWSGSHRTEWRAVLTAGRAYSRLYSYLGLHLKERLKRSKAVVELDDRLSGILSRFRYGK